jgi:hypothetical protein
MVTSWSQDRSKPVGFDRIQWTTGNKKRAYVRGFLDLPDLLGSFVPGKGLEPRSRFSAYLCSIFQRQGPHGAKMVPFHRSRFRAKWRPTRARMDRVEMTRERVEKLSAPPLRGHLGDRRAPQAASASRNLGGSRSARARCRRPGFFDRPPRYCGTPMGTAGEVPLAGRASAMDGVRSGLVRVLGGTAEGDVLVPVVTWRGWPTGRPEQRLSALSQKRVKRSSCRTSCNGLPSRRDAAIAPCDPTMAR